MAVEKTYHVKPPPGQGTYTEDPHRAMGQDARLGVGVLTMMAIVINVPGSIREFAVIVSDLFVVLHNS